MEERKDSIEVKQDPEFWEGFHRWEEVFATVKDMITATNFLCSRIDDPLIPDDIYTEAVRLHNCAVDFIEAMSKFVKEKED